MTTTKPDAMPGGTTSRSQRGRTRLVEAARTANRVRGPRLLRFAGLLSLSFLLACVPKGKAKAPLVDDDNSKAFSDLEKNDRDDGAAPLPVAKPEETKPKGPVYPAPFTAEQIHAATKNGRTYRYKVEVPDQPPKEYAVTFRKVDSGGAELSTSSDKSKRMSWLALQQHSEFPKDKVTTHPDKLKTPAGKFECVVYEVAGDEGEVWTFYFAKKLPGAPVFFYAERDGRRLRTTTLIEHVAGR